MNEMIVTIKTWCSEEVTGVLKSEDWKSVVITPTEPDCAEWHINKDEIHLWNGEEY